MDLKMYCVSWTQPKNDNQYLALSLEDLRTEIFRKRLTLEKIGKKIGKTKATISMVINDEPVLSEKAKLRIRKRICTFLSSIDKKLNKREGKKIEKSALVNKIA